MENDEEDCDDDKAPLHWVDCNETEEDFEKMKRLLARDPNCLNSTDSYCHGNASPLFRAVAYGHPSCVAFLLGAGADPDLDSPTTPVHMSIFGETSTIITTMLLKSGAKANAVKNNNLCAYVVSASRIRANETVRLLLSFGALTEDFDHLRSLQGGREFLKRFALDTPLAIAALEGNHDLFRLLLLHGAVPSIDPVQHGVTQVVQDAHSVPRLIAHECASSLKVKMLTLKTFHMFGGEPMQRLRNGDTAYAKYKDKNEDLRKLAEQLSGSVRPLMNICRLTVFRAIGRDYLNKVQKLRELLPKTVSDFLEFPEQT